MKLGIIGAMDSEVRALQESLTDASEYSIANMAFRAGKLQNMDVVVVRCGMGKVNAAMCVQILKDRFSVTHIINTGVAGSLDAALRIGDIVISTEAVQHDFDLSPIGFQRGEIPPFGLVAFPADPALQATALQASKKLSSETHVYSGRICSGDQFISGNEQKQQITDRFGGMCAEMEGASIAQCCVANDIPFVILRAISDQADDSGGISFAEFEADAAKHCIQIVQNMVSLITA